MTPTGWFPWANSAQLFLAGLAVMVALQHVAAGRQVGAVQAVRGVAAMCAGCAVILVANTVLLDQRTFGRDTGTLLFVRAAGLSSVALAALVVTGVRPRRVARVLGAVIAVLSVGRLVLWQTTDLLYAHRVADGVPQYGALSAPTSLVLLTCLFAYVIVGVARTGSADERRVLEVGVVGSIVVGAASVLATDEPTAELLTGYLSVPVVMSVVVVAWQRQRDSRRESLRLAADMVIAAGAREAAARDLEHRATHDELTGLPNRSGLRRVINEALRVVDGAGTVAVLVVNLDRFKTVNDAYGHLSGDQILRVVSERLQQSALPCDTVGRFGSDEFVIVCADQQGTDTVEQLSDRVHRAFQTPILADSIELQLAASVGVVLAESGDTNADGDTLLRDAVTAMHDAKARGAATGRFHRGLRSAVVYRADIERRLAGAVGRDEIVVHYQPIVDLPRNAIVGFEALARWRQGGRLIPPSEWIPVAETTELIHEIGEHVLLTAAAQLALWRAAGHELHMHVNVSPRQLTTQRLERAVHAALDGIPASALVVEVTESLALDLVASSTLRALQHSGVRTALDDFGTGYSALASVASLPIDCLKIDQSITRRINHRDGYALVSATLAIAEALNLSVVAEGVETAEQHEVLRTLGCVSAQGFLYGRPVDAACAGDLLAAGAPAVPASRQRAVHPPSTSSVWPVTSEAAGDTR